MKPRPIRVEGDIAYVPLTKGYVAIIDVEDVPLVQGQNWCAKRSGKTVYAMRKAPRDINGKQSSIHLHRVLTSAPPDLEVDHKDGNGLNNRRRGEAGNLRLATPRQNRYNQSRAKHNSSGLKGVTWSKVAKKWQAQIQADGVKRYLGLFVDPKAAHEAYNEASQRLHGDFGRTS